MRVRVDVVVPPLKTVLDNIISKMDPKSKCQICGALAKEKSRHYRHYNAICCLGCKAFFRRHIRGDNVASAYQCKGGGNCDLTLGRKICKDCRFSKCLKVGMDDSKVLNENDRKKYSHPRRKKRSRRSIQEASTSVLDDDATIDLIDDSSPEPNEPPDTPPEAIVIDSSPEREVEPFEPIIDITADEMPIDLSNKKDNDDDIIEVIEPTSTTKNLPILILDIQRFYFEISANFFYDSKSAHNLIYGQMNIESFSTKAFITLMETNILFMHHFAAKHPIFNTLQEHDQHLLLNNNAKLFKEYMTARYLVAETGLDQVNWIFGPNEPLGFGLLEELNVIDFDYLNKCGLIMSHMNPVAIENYKKCLEIIQAYFQYPRYHTPLISNFLLFATSHWPQSSLKRLVEHDKIQKIEMDARKLIKYGSDEIGYDIGTAYLSQLTATLQYMHELKQRRDTINCIVQESQCSVIFEQGLIEKLVNAFTQIRYDLPTDTSHVERLIDLQLNGQRHLLKNLVFEGVNLAKQRCIKLLKTVCSMDFPIRIPAQTMDMAFFIIGVKSETYTKFIDKVKFCAGIPDLGELEDKLRGIPNVLVHKSPEYQAMIDPHNVLKCERLTESIASFLKHDDIFVLVLMHFLLMHQEVHDCWYRSVKKLLLKKIKDLCVLDGVQDVPSMFNNLCDEIHELGLIQHRVLALNNPKHASRTE